MEDLVNLFFMECKTCGLVSDGLKYCEQCGEPLTPELKDAIFSKEETLDMIFDIKPFETEKIDTKMPNFRMQKDPESEPDLSKRIQPTKYCTNCKYYNIEMKKTLFNIEVENPICSKYQYEIDAKMNETEEYSRNKRYPICDSWDFGAEKSRIVEKATSATNTVKNPRLEKVESKRDEIYGYFCIPTIFIPIILYIIGVIVEPITILGWIFGICWFYYFGSEALLEIWKYLWSIEETVEEISKPI